MINKKVHNATPKTYDGIKFKSLLEVTVYKTLKQAGFKPKYEEKTFLLQESFHPRVPFYTKNYFKKKNHLISPLDFLCVKDERTVLGITYTPDFVFDYKKKTIIVEVKGRENDVFPVKFKMFRYFLQTDKEYKDKDIEVWEVFSKGQLLTLINHLKNG